MVCDLAVSDMACRKPAVAVAKRLIYRVGESVTEPSICGGTVGDEGKGNLTVLVIV